MMKKINKQKNSKKSNKGITLIALVVTIIVLLLLAGISISMLSGENGILSRTTQAKADTVAGEVQEERDLWNLAKTTDDYSNTNIAESLDELLERLGPNNKKLLTAEQVEEIKTTGQVTIGSRTIVFELKIGNVIEAEGLKKFKDENENEIDWIYFGKDDNGNNLITTAKPINDKFTWNKQPEGATDTEKIENSAKNWLYYDLQEGQDGYDDTDCTVENNINKFCANLYLKLYSNGENIVGKARSITLEDINRVTGYIEPTFTPIVFGTETGEKKYYYPTLDAKNQDTNTDVNPKVYKYWKKPIGTSEKTFTEVDIHPMYNYNSETCTSENMKYITGESNNYFSPYAVGSCSINNSSSSVWFYVSYVGNNGAVNFGKSIGASDSNGPHSFTGSDIRVRPVVSLKSGIKLNKVQ